MVTFYIPQKLKIGFDKRKDQYVDRLGFINYYKPEGDLRFKKAFDDWIDVSIPTEEYDNIPTEGFVLDKGDPNNTWKSFTTTPDYIRVYDPRGFEFNISTQNLLYILDFCEIKAGKLLTGEFVYAWIGEQGNNVQLLPVASPEYQEALKTMDMLLKKKEFKEEDLEVGKIYIHKKDGRLVYLGKFPNYERWCENGVNFCKIKGNAFFFAGISENEKVIYTYAYTSKARLKQLIGVEDEYASQKFMERSKIALEYDSHYTEKYKNYWLGGGKRWTGDIFENLK